jgi:hypothetical protein
VLAGERTFGKGVMQYYFPMADGSGVKLTVAKYLSPTGFDISRRGGLPPDISCHDFPRGSCMSYGGTGGWASALDCTPTLSGGAHLPGLAPPQHALRQPHSTAQL